MSERNPCRGWAEGDRVTYPGQDGAALMTGRVVIRRALETGRPYLKVQIESGGRIGAWVWPEGWILGEGPLQLECLECRQPFRASSAGSNFCPPCDREFERGAAGQAERIRSLPAYYGLPERSRPAPAPSPDDEERAAQRARDEAESPF